LFYVGITLRLDIKDKRYGGSDTSGTAEAEEHQSLQRPYPSTSNHCVAVTWTLIHLWDPRGLRAVSCHCTDLSYPRWAPPWETFIRRRSWSCCSMVWYARSGSAHLSFDAYNENTSELVRWGSLYSQQRGV